MIDPTKVLFVGLGKTAPFYYRCLLPAMAMGADYAGMDGEPPNMSLLTGSVKGKTQRPDFTDYEVVILQQARGAAWEEAIRLMQARGIVVLYEVDDHLHGIERKRDHDFRRSFSKEDLPEFERCMRVADGMIVSTSYLESAYRKFNKRRYICENAIDPKRYAYTKPERETVNIGWAGATGHRDAVMPWLKATAAVMRRHANTKFVSIGQNFAGGFIPHFGEDRALSIPWCAIEQYPAAMTSLDIALAPAARTTWYLGKSDLRWLEASALGIPTVAHPAVYRSIREGETGFRAERPEQVVAALDRLVTDSDLRTTVGQEAKRHVLTKRAFPGAAMQWEVAIDAAVAAAERRRAALVD